MNPLIANRITTQKYVNSNLNEPLNEFIDRKSGETVQTITEQMQELFAYYFGITVHVEIIPFTAEDIFPLVLTTEQTGIATLNCVLRLEHKLESGNYVVRYDSIRIDENYTIYVDAIVPFDGRIVAIFEHKNERSEEEKTIPDESEPPVEEVDD